MIEWISKIIKRPKSAITLVELMIAMGLATLVAGAVVGIMATGSRMWKGGVSKLKTVEQESVLLTRIAKELEEASKIYWADGTGIAFYRQGYTVEGTFTPHGCTGTNLNHANCSNPSAVPWDTLRYAGGPYWRGLSSDVVWFYYTKTVGGKGIIVRKVTDGFTPTLSGPQFNIETTISDPDIDIAKLRFTYWNFMGYFFDDRIRAFSPIPPGTTDVTPDTRIVQAKITPSDYPQNIWKTMEWTRNILANTAYTQYARVMPEGNVSVWWEDVTPTCITGACGETSLPTFNPWSGLTAVRVGPTGNPNVGIKTAQIPTASPAQPASNNLLYFSDSVPSGSFSLAKQPTADTDTPNGCQLDITLGGKKKVVGAAIEESECTGYITIAGTDPANASISTTMEFFGCGFTLTTPNIFKTVNANGITTTGLSDEKFSDETPATATAMPSITITNPNKKVSLLVHLYLDPYPLDNVRILALQFNIGGAWRTAYWAHPNDRYADNDSDTIMDINELTSNLSADGRDRMYMGPLPPVGGWTVIGIPLAYPGTRLEGAAVGANGMRVSVFNGRAYLDKVVYGTWNLWQSLATASGSSLSGLGEANYIQFRGELATSAPTSSPTLSDTTIKHGKQGGLSWTRTSDEDWMQGTFSNTVPSYGDVALWRTSGPDNLTQGEVGPSNIDLKGYSYYGVQAPGYAVGSTAGVWQKIRWTRSGEVGWAVDLPDWNYRRRITLQETKGLVRFRDVVVVDIPPANVNANGSDIRITTLNGTLKPFRYIGQVNGTNHRIMFLGNCPGMGTFTYFVYYGNAAATMPTYSKGSTPALPAGTGIVGNYFNYNVRYRGGDYYPFFPTNSGPSPGSYQGSFISQRRDNNMNFNWGNGSPGTGVSSDYFSVGWRGWMFIDAIATRAFRIARDGDNAPTDAGYNARLWVNNSQVVSVGSAQTQVDGTSAVLGIGLHQIMVNYSEYSGASSVAASWQHPTRGWEVIPIADLYPNWGGNAWDANYWQFVDKSASNSGNGYGNVNYTIGNEQSRGTIDYPDKITVQTRSSEDGTSWPGGWQTAHDPASYPNDGGATTSDFNITDGLRRFLQFRANLSTLDTTVTPIVAEVKVYNVALDPDGDSTTGVDGWLTQTSQDDWEAGMVGTYTDAGYTPAELRQVPDTNVRKYKGAVTLASEVGNLINATEERTANINVKKDTTSSHIWDRVSWLLGTPSWPQPRYKYRKKVTLTEQDGTPRFLEPVVVTVESANIQADGKDVRVVDGNGQFKAFQILQTVAGPPRKITIMFLASCAPKQQVSYFIYYGRIDPATGTSEVDTGESYTKTSTVKWPNGKGVIGNYFSYPCWYDQTDAERDPLQYWGGTFQGQRQDSTINFNWGCGNPGVGSIGNDYFSVGWRGYLFLNGGTLGSSDTWGFKIQREDGVAPAYGEAGCGVRADLLGATKQKGNMRLYVDGTFAASQDTKGYSGIDIGSGFTNRYLNGTQRLSQDNTTTGTSSTTTALASCTMRLLEVNYAEYAGNASAKLYWTPPAGSEAIIPQGELYGFYSRLKSGFGSQPLSSSWGTEEMNQFDDSQLLNTTVQLQTQISENGQIWDAPVSYTTYQIGTDTGGYAQRDIASANGNKRYVQMRMNLSTTDITRTPILTEVGLFNRAVGRYYVLTDQADFEAGEELNSVDTSGSPGSVMLTSGSGQNLAAFPQSGFPALDYDKYEPNYGKNNYADEIWTKILWIRAYAKWLEPEYRYRQKITFSETSGMPRINEPAVFEVANVAIDGNAAGNGKDIRITNMNGKRRAYQLIQTPPPYKILMLVSCAPNSSVSYYLYYYKLNSAGDAASGRASDTGETYTKSTTTKWSSGTGIVGTYFSNRENQSRTGWGASNKNPIFHDTFITQQKDLQINFNPFTPFQSDYFSAVWNGWVYTNASPSASYTFRFTHDEWINCRIRNLGGTTESVIRQVAGTGADADGAAVTLNAGLHRIWMDYDEYLGASNMILKGIATGGGANSASVIPTSELYGFYGGAGTAKGNTIGDDTWFESKGYGFISTAVSGTIEDLATIGVDTTGTIEVYTQGSHNDVGAYSALAPASPGYTGGTGTWTNIAAADGRYRYLKFRANLSTPDTTKTPILAEVQLYNKAASKTYTLTTQDEWKMCDLSAGTYPLDADSYAGSVALQTGTGTNIASTEETGNYTLSIDTYRASIWKEISWLIGYTDWKGDNRLYRKKLTITEPGTRDREFEVIDVDHTFPAARIRADGGDILLTNEIGTRVPYQLISSTTSTFKIRIPVLIDKGGKAVYYVYYGDATITPPVYSKTTDPRFPNGSGVLRRRWTNSDGSNESSITKTTYQGRDAVSKITTDNIGWNYFSTRFDGWIYATGNHNMKFVSDDHHQVWRGGVGGTDYLLQTGVNGEGSLPYGLSAGFNRLTVDLGDYTGDVSITAYGVKADGTADIAVEIPDDALYPCWTDETNLSSDPLTDNGSKSEFRQAVAGTVSFDSEENKGPLAIAYGKLKIETRGSHDGTTWVPASPAWTLILETNPSASGGPIALGVNGNYRYLQWKATLDTAGNTSYSPILAELKVINSAQNDRIFLTTERTDFTPNAGESNVDYDRSPGDLMLDEGAVSNTNTLQELSTISISENTYLLSVWTKIKWGIGYDDWPGGVRLYRKLITVSEPNVMPRTNEPIEVQVTVAAAADVCDNGNDILLTTEAGSTVAYQLTSSPGVGVTFKILFPATVTQGSSTKYYVYYGDSLCSYASPPAPPSGYSKTTSPSFPEGLGVVRRTWSNWDGANNGTIDMSAGYGGKTIVSDINYSTGTQYFSAKFEGWIYRASTGATSVRTNQNNHIWAYLNSAAVGRTCTSNTEGGCGALDWGTLNTGFNRITIETGNYEGSGNVYLYWGGGTILIPQSDLYMRWTTNTDIRGGGDDATTLTYTVAAVENKSPTLAAYGKVKIETYGSHAGSTWVGPTLVAAEMDPPYNRSTPLNLIAGGYRFLKIKATLTRDAVNVSRSPIMDNIWVMNVDTWYGADGQLGWKGTEVPPSPECGARIKTNIDEDNRAGDILLDVTTASALSFAELGPISIGITKDTYANPVWSNINWVDCGFDYVRYRTASTSAGIASATWSTDINPDTPPTCSTTSAGISGTNRYIQYNLKQTHRDRTTVIDYVRLTDAEQNVNDTVFSSGSTPTGSWAEIPGNIRVVRWNATSDATVSGQSNDLSTHTYRRRYEFGTKNETREPVEFTVTSAPDGYATQNFTVCRYDDLADTMQIVAHKLMRKPVATQYTLLIMLTADNQVFYVYYGGTRISTNPYTKTHWNNSYGTGTGIYGSCYHNNNVFFSIASESTVNSLKANINFNQDLCFVCNSPNYFQDAWRGWVYTDTNADLYVTPTNNANADCEYKNEAGTSSGFAGNPVLAVTAQSWYRLEVRHRGYATAEGDNNDSVLLRGDVSNPFPQSHLYGVRYFDPNNYHSSDTSQPSPTERSQQDVAVGGEFYSRIMPPARYADYYIYPGWYGYPVASDIKLYFDKAYLEADGATVIDKIQIIRVSDGAVLTTYDSPRNAVIDTGWIGDVFNGNADMNYILVRYYYLRTATSPSPGMSIQNMRIRPCSANGGNSGANRPKLAIDGNIATYWIGGAPDKTITFDSGSVQRLFRYRFRVVTASATWKYKFYVSDDNASWVQVSDPTHATTGINLAAGGWADYSFPSRNARYGRLEILAGSPDSSIYEIELYATTYFATGTHEKTQQPDWRTVTKNINVKGREAYFTFSEFNLKTGTIGATTFADELKIINTDPDPDVTVATYTAGAFPPAGGTTGWLKYNTTDASTLRGGLNFKFELKYLYSGETPAGYKVSQVDWKKLAYEEDRATTHITTNPPWKAIDGSTAAGNYWDGGTPGVGNGLIIDLGKMKNVFKYKIVTNLNGVYRYKVDVSTDRANWKQVSDNYDGCSVDCDPWSAGWNTSSGAGLTYTDTFNQQDARWVRLTLKDNVPANPDNLIREFEVYPVTYQTDGYLMKQLPTDMLTDNKYMYLPARNARIRFSQLYLRGNDTLKIFDVGAGLQLGSTLTSTSNGANIWIPGAATFFTLTPEKHTSAGLVLKLELSYNYSADPIGGPAGYTVDQFYYKKLAYDVNEATLGEDIHTANREPFYAIDNDTTTTYWQTTGTNNVSLVIDFGKLTKLNKTQWYGVAGANYKYKILTSVDGGDWEQKTDDYRWQSNQTMPASPGNFLEDSFGDTECRFVKINFVDSGVNATVYEFKVSETKFNNPGAVLSVPFPLPLRAWEFNKAGDAQNWTNDSQLNTFTVSNGALSTSSTGIDPYMRSQDNLGISGDTATGVLIRMNVSAAGTGQLFFTTDAAPVEDEAKSRQFTLSAGYKQYFIDMSDVPGWAGNTIKRLRIDPTGASAISISIDYIRVLQQEKDTKEYIIGARDTNLHFSKLYLRGYDRMKIYSYDYTDSRYELMLVYRNNYQLSGEYVDAGYNYPGGGYPAVTVDLTKNMVTGAGGPTPGADPNGFWTNWLYPSPIENGYGIKLKVEYIYDYQGENSGWDGYLMDVYRTKVLAWDNDNNSASNWQIGSPPVNYVGTDRPSLAIDNSTATLWDGGAAPQKLLVDLGRVRNINKVNIEYDSSATYYQYEVVVSVDGAEWLRVSNENRLNQIASQPTGGYVDTFLVKEARYVALITTVVGNATNVRVKEFRIHEAQFQNPGYLISYKLPSLKTGQQLQNYGFELNSGTTTPTYWTKSGTGTVEHVSDVRPNNASSKQSIRLTDVATLTSNAISVNSTDEVNAQFYEYYLSGWIKTVTNDTATLAIQWQTGAGVDIGVPQTVALNSTLNTWTYFEGVYISPATAGQACVIISNPDAGSSALFDDLRFSLADFQYDVKTIRAAAGQIKPHFSRFDMEGTAIEGVEKLRDILLMYNDSTGAIIDVDGAAGNQLRTVADGGLLPNPLTQANDIASPGPDPLGYWTSYLGTADVRVVLRYNYTGLANKGYTIDQYKYRPRAYACHTDGTNIPDKAIDNISDNLSSYWSPAAVNPTTEVHWIEVDLGKVASLRKVSVVNQYVPSATYNYKVELSADGETYTDIQSLTPTPLTPNPWTTGVLSGTYTSSGFAQTFTRFDAQYVRVTYETGTTNPKTLEIKIWQTPYINPGSLTSEILPPKRRYDPPTTTTEDKVKGAANETVTLANTPVHRVLRVCGGAKPACTVLYREHIDYIPTSTGIDWSPTDGAMEPTTGTTYNVQYEYGDVSSDGAILRGTWNTTANVDTDWSFNNDTWAGDWVTGTTAILPPVIGAPAGPNYQTVSSNGTLNAAVSSLNAGVWDGRMSLYYPSGDNYIYSVNKTDSGGLFDAGIPSLGTDYTVARHLQANFQISGAATDSAWAFMTRDGYNGTWNWKYTSAKTVSTTGEFISLTWDMLDGGAAAGTDHPWITIVNNPAINNGVQTQVAGKQPPPDVTPPTRPTNEYQRLIVDNTPVLRIDISGATTVWGSVKITGVDAWGIGIDETVKFRVNGTMNTRRKFARVDTIATSGFTGGNITVRCLSFSGTIGRLAFRALSSGARYVFIDSLRALPKVSYQKPYIMLEGTTIPGSGGVAPLSNDPTKNPNNSANAVNWAGAGWVSLRFSKFNLYADDILQIWGKSTAGGSYDRLLRNFDKNSFPTTGGWTGNLGWGYDDFKIVLYHTPTGDSVGGNPAVTIDQFFRSLNFYSSTNKENSKPNFGAWRGADGDITTYWKACAVPPSSSCVALTWPVALNNYQGWYVDLGTSQLVNRAVVKWKSDVVAPGEFMIIASQDCTNFTPANIVAQGGQTYIFASMNAQCVGVVHPKDGANANRNNVEIELAEFEIYPAGDYVSRGNYYSQPYAAGAHMQWIIPYPKDAYDMRVHFTKFQTQVGASADTSDIFRMYNDMTGWRWNGTAWVEMSENTLIGTAHSNTTPPVVTNLPTGQPLLKVNNCAAPLDPQDPNMRRSYNPLECDTFAYQGGPVGGYRTPWLLAGNDGRYPSSFDTRNMGMRWKLLFTAPLGYKDQNSWEIDRYELYSVINPTLIQIDILTRHGTGRDRRMSSQTTKVQPPNLVFR